MSRLQITLKPVEAEGLVQYVDISYAFDQLCIKEGAQLFQMQLCTVSIPGCTPEEVRVTDEAGDVPLLISESAPYPYELRHYAVEREVCGALTLAYRVRPRVLTAESTCGPYFDLRTEENGANSAGLSFLADFIGYEGDISLSWDLSSMAEGSTGVCSLGEGCVRYTGALELLRQCYFAFGRVSSLTNGEFGFYWLTEPSFDMNAIAEYTQKLFAVMQDFFEDTQPNYRIFVRKDPFPTSGGTALHRSYMFGWNDTQPVSVADKQNILAHEMVHNWPHLNDNPYGISSWYSEGTAEYYCVMLPYRAKLVSLESTLDEIQRRTNAYYTNPTRHMENLAAARICWQDRRAQRLPYGRGFFFLANTDVRIREATHGQRSLDDVVIELIRRDRAGVTLGNPLFLEIVRELSGVDVSKEWKIMCEGKHFAPLSDSFDALFTVKEISAVEADTGEPCVSYTWAIRTEEKEG